MKNQTVTSANTSINVSKLPAIYGKLDKLPAAELSAYDSILDYGCGRYTRHIMQHVVRRGRWYLGMDKYNQTDRVNAASRRFAARLHPVAVCSNVLNVIDSDDTIRDVIRDIMHLSDRCYITVYEGDKTGRGRYTTPDCYQRNARLRDYAALVPACYNVRFVRGMMEVTR